ncbi:MAG: hypothetical protein AB7D57_01745 [Desulfovibrionaceae bacterium]
MAWWMLVAWVAVALLGSLLGTESKKSSVTPAGLGDWNISTAEETKRVPVLFGTRLVPVNIVWYGDLRVSAIKKKGGKK